jgi:lactate 2-monooxygenase
MENIISEFNQFQKQIYINGFFGEKSLINPDWQKLEMQALAKMSKEAAAYIGGGAGLQQSMKNNRNGFDALKIVPKMLAGGDQRNTSVKIFDVNFPSPFWLCPIGRKWFIIKQISQLPKQQPILMFRWFFPTKLL